MLRLVAVVVLFGSLQAVACVCMDDPGLCPYFTSLQGAIFVGRVTAVRKDATGGRSYNQRVIFAVHEAFRGVNEKKITLRNLTGTDCSGNFRKGQTYLVYTAGMNGAYYASGCLKISLAKFEGDEIAHLRRLASAPPGGVIVGTLKTYASDRNFVSALNQPVSGQTISVEGPLGNREVRTDESGRYAVVGLMSGPYRVKAMLDIDYVPVISPEVSMEPNGCSEVDFRTDKKGQQAAGELK